MNIIQAISDDKLFKSSFKNLETWSSWLVLLKSLFALPMDEKELSLYRECTGREKPPENEFKELWCISGRRSGKSFMAAIIAVYLALFYRYDDYLTSGEQGTIQIIASDRSQASVIMGYIKGILKSNPIFSQYVVNVLRESVELSNKILVEVQSCSYRSIRGRTVVCCIGDEMSFWRSEGSSPDAEILAAVRPSMATVPNSKLIVVSSPYSQWGCVFESFKKYYGSDSQEILVWRSDTRTMNPSISQSLIDAETAKDPQAARSEWGGYFREDLELFLSREAVESCCSLSGVLAPRHNFSYRAFCDPSGGRNDSFSLAIGHNEHSRLVCDLLKDYIPPFNPESVVREISDILRSYRIDKLIGDKYGAAWVESSFEKAGIRYSACEKAKSELYLNFEGYVNTSMVELPNNPKLVNELCALERRRGKAGKDSVDHPPRGSDDLANSVAGLCYESMITSDRLIPHVRCGVDYSKKEASA